VRLMPYRWLDAKRLMNVSRDASDECLEDLAIELGVESDAETVSFMRQAFMKVAVKISDARHAAVSPYRPAKVRGAKP
jgi:hypothetical protein